MNAVGSEEGSGREGEESRAEFTCGYGLGLEQALAAGRNASKRGRAGATAKGIEVGKASVGGCLAYRWREHKGHIYKIDI